MVALRRASTHLLLAWRCPYSHCGQNLTLSVKASSGNRSREACTLPTVPPPASDSADAAEVELAGGLQGKEKVNAHEMWGRTLD